MKGTRPLDNDEIRLVSACFNGTLPLVNFHRGVPQAQLSL